MKKYFFLLIVFLPVYAAAQGGFQIPAESKEIVKNVPWAKATAIAESFGKIFSDCDKAKKGDQFSCPSPSKPAKTLKNGCSGDPNRNTAILKFPDGTVFFDGKMAIDADGSEFAKKTGGVNQPETSVRIKGKSLDASKVPFIVIPQDASAAVSFMKSTKAGLGDIAAVVFKNRIIFAVVGDAGPSCRIGEGSIEAHERLGNHICKNAACDDIKENNGIGKEVLYFIFPNTDVRKVPGMTMTKLAGHIKTEGKKLFDRLQLPGQ